MNSVNQVVDVRENEVASWVACPILAPVQRIDYDGRFKISRL